MRLRSTLLTLAAMLLAAPALAAGTRVIALPHGAGGLDFDDLGFAPALDRVIVPAAQSGNIALIDPADQHVTLWKHVVPGGSGADRDDRGTTSADSGAGLVFASDHADRAVVVIDPRDGKVVARAPLKSGPDYVRYVASLHQLWVTEPGAAQIERFRVQGGARPALVPIGTLAVPHGPESLVIDDAAGVAYTNEWNNHTLTITLVHPHISARWTNPCRGSRGLALAPSRHLLFVGCKEGRVIALRTDRDGRVVGNVRVGAGVDIIAWNPRRHHVYAPGARSATLSVVAVGAHGALKRVDTVPTGRGSHCVTTDGRSHAYVCLPRSGGVLVYRDAASR